MLMMDLLASLALSRQFSLCNLSGTHLREAVTPDYPIETAVFNLLVLNSKS